jgi:hypothetical protein
MNESLNRDCRQYNTSCIGIIKHKTVIISSFTEECQHKIRVSLEGRLCPRFFIKKPLIFNYANVSCFENEIFRYFTTRWTVDPDPSRSQSVPTKKHLRSQTILTALMFLSFSVFSFRTQRA